MNTDWLRTGQALLPSERPPGSHSPMPNRYDVVVVGAGPNGLAAAITAARAGLSTCLIEGGETVGGGTRSAQLTLPGFVHDVCSSVHPMGIASPFFNTLPLAEHGLDWCIPPVAYAHPLDTGDAAAVSASLEETAHWLGRDGDAYRASIGALTRSWPNIEHDLLGPIGIPTHPLQFLSFGVRALLPASTFARLRFASERGRALIAGAAAHSMVPLERPGSTSFAMVLAVLAHVRGWPVARGGSQAIANALASYLRSLGGEIITGQPVESIDALPKSKVVLFDTSPRELLRLARSRLHARSVRALQRFRYGPGVFKVDWALDAPIPWKAEICSRTATVHVGGTLREIAEAERAPWRGEDTDRPFVIVTQPSLFDHSRAPAGKHTAWGYCHVPNGSLVDMTERIERQIERFAPGFRDQILARAVREPTTLERYNPNLVGGDIGGGANTLLQLLFRPTWRMYSVGTRGIYLCSASTPPGGGVHGMCGYHAASWAITREFGVDVS